MNLISFKGDLSEVFDSLCRSFVHSRCENGIWSPGNIQKYLIPHTVSFTDKYGQWEKDLFFGHLKIFLTTNEAFPKFWKTDSDKVSI